MREDYITGILSNLVNNDPNIAASALISTDGLVIASALAADMDEDRLGAMVTTVLSFSDATSQAMTCGTLEQVMISGKSGHMLALHAGAEAILCLIARNDIKYASLFKNASDAATAIMPRINNAPDVIYYDSSFTIFDHQGGLTAQDQAMMRTIQPSIDALLPHLVDEFYQVILEDPSASPIPAGQAAILKSLHLRWLENLFGGDYSAGFIRRQSRAIVFQQTEQIPAVLVATSLAFLRGALPPLIGTGIDERKTITAVLLRLFDLCQTLTAPKYSQLFLPFMKASKPAELN